jgi:hypothetical protein
MRRIELDNMAVDEPIEQMPQGREPLLDARCRELSRRRLNPGSDVHWLEGSD